MPPMRRLSWALLLLAACSGPEANPKSPDPYERYLGVRELGETAGSRDRIRELLKDRHPLVVVGALEALGDLGDPGYLLYVVPFVTDETRDPMVRAYACVTLARLRNAEAVPFL